METLGYFLYNLAIIITSPLIGVYYFLRLWRRGLPISGVSERLGLVRPLPQAGSGGRLWLHAVSVGEVGVAAALLPALRKESPDLQIVLSTVTETGRKEAEKIEGIENVFYLPFDYRFAVRIALRRTRPSALAMVETELWPNLIREASRSGVPVAVINGRLGEKSFRGYRRFRFLFGPAMERMAGIGARGREDVARFEELGAGKVTVTGNIKYDAPVPELTENPAHLKKKYGLADADPVIVAGSTHPGEELIVGKAIRELQAHFPHIGLLIAPRHLNRLSEVESALRDTGLEPMRWSQNSRENTTGRTVILDQMGMLGEAYACGTVAFIGGSLIPHGGQNLIEAARWGVPVIFGPHTHNFQEVADEILQVGGGICVSKAKEVSEALTTLLNDKDARDRAGEAALEAVMANRGAAERTAKFLAEILSSQMEKVG